MGVEYQPLFYDIYKRYGAVYWLAEPYDVRDDSPHSAWDINYFTMGFEAFQNGALGHTKGHTGAFNNSDACLMRVVYTK